MSASDDKTARVWEVATGNPLTPPMRHDGRIWHLEISPDGTRAVTGSPDKTARIRDLQTGELIAPPLKHDADLWEHRQRLRRR